MCFAELRLLWRSDPDRYYGKADSQTSLRMLPVYREAPGAKYASLLRLVAYLRVSTPRPVVMPLYVLMRILLKHDEYAWPIRIPPSAQASPGPCIGHVGDSGSKRHLILGTNGNISQGVFIGQSSRGPVASGH